MPIAPNRPLSADSHAPDPLNQSLLKSGRAVPQFLQGVFPFAGRGAYDLAPLHELLSYAVPTAHTAQVVYFRAGNLSDDLLYFALVADGVPTRYFPIAPKGDVHVALAITESYAAGTVLELHFAAPRGLTGTLIVDMGVLEIAD